MNELAAKSWDHMAFQLARGYRPPDERAFTDHHAIELGIRHDPAVQARLFDGSQEATTGADFEWWVTDGSQLIAMLVQAKKLAPSDRYAGLNRNIGGKAGAPRQIDRLIDVCRTGVPGADGTFDFVGYEPMYLLYNGPRSSGKAFPADRCKNGAVGLELRGCAVAPAEAVRAALDASPGNQNSVEAITPLAWPWQCLFCCPLAEDHGSAPARIAAMLAGGAPSGGTWQPADISPQDEGLPRIWELDEAPEYVRLMTWGDLGGDEIPHLDALPGAQRVFVWRLSPDAA